MGSTVFHGSVAAERLEDIVRTFILPGAAERDRLAIFPRQVLKALAEAGLMGLPYPTEMGGGGASFTEYIRTVQSISRACAATGVVYATHVSLACFPIYMFGSPEQQERWLRPMLAGKFLGAFALTERDAGTDIDSIAATAVRTDGGYVVHGHKIYITNAGEADVYILFASAQTDTDRKLCAFIVSPDDKGMSISDPQRKLGIRAAQTCEVFMDNVFLPDDRLLGRQGDGRDIALRTLDVGRIGIAAQSVGIAQSAMEIARRRMAERRQFNKCLASFQGLRWKIADMWVKNQAAELLMLQAAERLDRGLPFRAEAAAAKLFASETAAFCTDEAMQLCGGSGYLSGSEAERLYRDARITKIYEGTSEAQRIVIAHELLSSSKASGNQKKRT